MMMKILIDDEMIMVRVTVSEDEHSKGTGEMWGVKRKWWWRYRLMMKWLSWWWISEWGWTTQWSNKWDDVRSEVEMMMKILIHDEMIMVRVSLWVRMYNTVKEQVRWCEEWDGNDEDTDWWWNNYGEGRVCEWGWTTPWGNRKGCEKEWGGNDDNTQDESHSGGTAVEVYTYCHTAVHTNDTVVINWW